MSNQFFYKRMRPEYLPLPPNKRAKLISFRRPRGYKQSQAWQDWRAMKVIASRPIPPAPSNYRSGGYLGKERKFKDSTVLISLAPAWTLASPATGALNAVAQGNGETERDGRKISNSSLHINGSFVTRSHEGSEVRIIVFKDTQTNGAAPSPANVIVGGINGFRNLEWVNRFRILYDKTFVVNPQVYVDPNNANTPTSNAPCRDFRANFKLTDTTMFDNTTADIANITDNSYHVMACSTDSSMQGTLEFTSRFRFYG